MSGVNDVTVTFAYPSIAEGRRKRQIVICACCSLCVLALMWEAGPTWWVGPIFATLAGLALYLGFRWGEMCGSDVELIVSPQKLTLKNRRRGNMFEWGTDLTFRTHEEEVMISRGPRQAFALGHELRDYDIAEALLREWCSTDSAEGRLQAIRNATRERSLRPIGMVCTQPDSYWAELTTLLRRLRIGGA